MIGASSELILDAETESHFCDFHIQCTITYFVKKSKPISVNIYIYIKKKKLIQGAFHNLIFGKTQTSSALRLFSVYAI